MRKYFGTVALVLFFRAVFIPFASSSPDGLERMAETFGIKEPKPVWKGIMPNYSIGAVADPYVSTLFAGVSGTLLVLFAALILGTAIAKKPTADPSDQ